MSPAPNSDTPDTSNELPKEEQTSEDARRRGLRLKRKRPVSRHLRYVLHVVLVLFSVLAANGIYLASISWLQETTGEIYETHFYQLMFLAHLGLGLLLIFAHRRVWIRAHVAFTKTPE